ncbi:DNA helicase MCM9 isoform X2 [Parambassis ranga]|uniref:DNA helicase MCM9 n=1 Tax=Parambassis ranga TaxID=210632 RepID=A0A6P7HSA7_9TELE|nr:DNA helicase MCM9 isoform X2 [Parambassis ranga]
MLISPEQEALMGRVFESYLMEHHQGDILQLITDTNEETHLPVVVNAMTLFEANMEVGDYFNAYPHDVLAIFDKVLHRKALELLEKAFPQHHGEQRTKEQRMRHTLHARITGLPVCPELTRDTIPRSRDVGHFLSVTGTVIRTSVAKVLEYERDYMCTKCRHVFTLQADFDQFYTFVSPVSCPNPDGCNSYKFTCLSGGSEPAACRDYQEIKIQEQVQRLSVGSIPRSLVVVLEDDLVDSCKSGDDVTVYGVVCQRWKPFYEGCRCEVELVLKANNIEVNNQQTAAALLMKDAQKEFEEFWDSYKHDPIAGECHMLLVGDPGTGKSQFLKYAAKVISRSVLTAGIGSTNAGLTVAAVKDGGDWHLEAGALVLSDGGLCCIDEFNSIKEHDRISIHEAMEQQSISVAKAGMVCKLNTRTSILAATNPKGQYDPNEPLSVNVALASPLLSRFDLVLVLLDTRNAEWDRIISSFILEDREMPAESSGLWPMDKMKTYFSVIKQLQPQVSEDANYILARYYQLQRQSNGRNAARTTIRMLESLSRLAEAHARLMYRETVTIEDAVIAVSVMECSMQGGALLGNVNALLTSFPADPQQQYQTQCQVLLEGLNLPSLLQQEMNRLARLKSNTAEDSQSVPPTAPQQDQIRGTGSVNKTPSHNISSHVNDGVTVEGGLSWLHARRISLSPDDTTMPMLTSTQETTNKKPNTSWSDVSTITKQTESNTLSHNCDSVSNPIGTIVSSSEEENRKGDNHDKVGCALQKVSKIFRNKTLRQPEVNQQCDKVGGGLGKRVVSGGDADKNVTDYHNKSTLSSDENRPSHTADKGGGSEKENTTELPKRTTNIIAVLKEKMTAEADKDLPAKFSRFVFKPRKMRPSDHDQDTTDSSDKCVQIRKTQKPHSHDESVRTLTNKTKQQNDSEAGDMGADVCSASGGRESVFSVDKVVQGGTEGKEKGNDEAELRSPFNTEEESFTCIRPLKPDNTKTAVAPSTLDKLSRFSFICTEPTKAAPTGVETSPPQKNNLELLTSNSKVGKTLNSPSLCQKSTATLLVDKMTDGLPSTSPQVTPGQGHEQRTELTHAANLSDTVNGGPVTHQSTVNLKKRKCFELGPALRNNGASSGLFSGLSLFASAELCNDVLETDWDQEVFKKAKV